MSNYATKPIPKDKPEVVFVKRPWGSFRQYANNRETTVSMMKVLPGQRLSLQSHTGRAELWLVIDDGAIVQIGENIKKYNAGDELWIPANTKHRLSCGADRTNPVRVLEVAFGNWQQEDIERHQDDYKR